MKELWKSVTITKIDVAVYVAPNPGKHIHKKRPFHGFVLNDGTCARDYYFDDGRVLRTEKNSLFYLPKGSSYHTEQRSLGGCYAVNFDAEVREEPFSVPLRNANALQHRFKAATDAWKGKDPLRIPLAMLAVYDAICCASKELQRQYVSGDGTALLAPAVAVLQQSFTEADLNVSALAALCGISEVYFRKLFRNSFGVSPKEYLIQKRIDYAKTLLQSGNFSVSAVAELCGYGELSRFSRAFATREGIAPSQYANS